MKCEKCGIEHNGKYGSGRFCSAQCARGFASKHVSEEGRKKQKEVLTNEDNRTKMQNVRKSHSNNYELDTDGNWKKIEKSNKNKFMDTKDRHKKSTALGKVGELFTAKKFIEHGYNVYIPLIDDGTDMVVEKDNGLKKIQVKAASSTNIDDSVTKFTLQSSTMYLSEGNAKIRNKKYNKKDVDYFALYSAIDNDVYLIKNDESHSHFTIRSKPSKNHTVTGKNLEKIHMAEDYQIDKVLDDIDDNPDYDNIIYVDDFSDNSNT